MHLRLCDEAAARGQAQRAGALTALQARARASWVSWWLYCVNAHLLWQELQAGDTLNFSPTWQLCIACYAILHTRCRCLLRCLVAPSLAD